MELKRKKQMSMIFITHDLGVVAHVADRVAVMYSGTIVETAPVAELFSNPKHPYTYALLKSIPRIDRKNEGLTPIQGMVPPIDKMPKGCRFFCRCSRNSECGMEKILPELLLLKDNPDHLVRCPLAS